MEAAAATTFHRAAFCVRFQIVMLFCSWKAKQKKDLCRVETVEHDNQSLFFFRQTISHV